jgi:uncharacterized repeat protein (TIGR03803 family)
LGEWGPEGDEPLLPTQFRKDFPMRRPFLPFYLFATVSAIGCSSTGASGVPPPLARTAGDRVAPTQSFQVLHTFKDGHDGAEPDAGLLLDGALYGTTYRGGDRNDAGTVYKVTPSGEYSIIHRFVRHAPSGQRANPDAGLISDRAGNFYGTTLEGGPLYKGTVYKISARGRYTILYTFTGPEGEFPRAPLIRDSGGSLYGVTEAGGNSLCEGGGCGTVFKVDTAGKASVLYAFTGGTDGHDPIGGLVRDKQGNLYGTTISGGTSNCAGEGCGIAFKIDTSGQETVLHRFTEGLDGGHPAGALLQGSGGNLYGTTDSGGKVDAGGTVFKIDKTGNETVLYNFTGGSDGAGPFDGLFQDAAGDFFGTTEFGGGSTGCQSGCGTVFELDSSGHEMVLYRFTGKEDGAYPLASVVMDAAGFLYGTASEGGDGTCANGLGCGVAFKLKP